MASSLQVVALYDYGYNLISLKKYKAQNHLFLIGTLSIAQKKCFSTALIQCSLELHLIESDELQTEGNFSALNPFPF